MEQNKDQSEKLLYAFANAYCTMNTAGRQEAKYAATPAVEEAKQAVIDHFGSVAVRGEAVAIPDGWTIGNACEGRITVQHKDVGVYSAQRQDDGDASAILYELACSLRYAPVSARAADALDSQPTDAARYQRLRVLGAAPCGSKQLDAGNVLRFQGLDAFIDADLAAHPSRGEASSQPTDGGVRNGSEPGRYDEDWFFSPNDGN